MVLKDKVFVVALVLVILAGGVSADVFIDADVSHDIDVFYDGMDSESRSISLIGPADALSQSHNDEFFFNASYISATGDPFLNLTLHVWDSGGDEYFISSNVSDHRPDEISIVAGTYRSGDLASLAADDLNVYNVSEAPSYHIGVDL